MISWYAFIAVLLCLVTEIFSYTKIFVTLRHQRTQVHDHTQQLSQARGCLHDIGATFIPARVHSGSLLLLCIRLHDTNTKCYAGASHTGASSPRFLCRSEIFIPARKFIPVSCKRGMTVRFMSIKVSSVLRHYKTLTPTNTALCKHGATFHLAPEWKSCRYHVNTPQISRTYSDTKRQCPVQYGWNWRWSLVIYPIVWWLLYGFTKDYLERLLTLWAM